MRGAILTVAKLGAWSVGTLVAVLGHALEAVRVPGRVRRELSSRNGAAARLAVLNEAQREAHFYGLSDEALGELLMRLGRDVLAGRFRR